MTINEEKDLFAFYREEYSRIFDRKKAHLSLCQNDEYQNAIIYDKNEINDVKTEILAFQTEFRNSDFTKRRGSYRNKNDPSKVQSHSHSNNYLSGKGSSDIKNPTMSRMNQR